MDTNSQMAARGYDTNVSVARVEALRLFLGKEQKHVNYRYPDLFWFLQEDYKEKGYLHI